VLDARGWRRNNAFSPYLIPWTAKAMQFSETFGMAGFCVTPSWLDANGLVHVRHRVEQLHRRALSGDEPQLSSQCVFEKDLPASKRNGLEVNAAQNAVFIFPDPSHYDPFFLSILTAPKLIALVQRLLGTDDIVIHFANITSKSPHVGSGISWHRDFPNKYICPATPDMVRTMICLDGMEESRGATRFITGSQHDAAMKSNDIPEGDARIGTAHCEPGAIVAIHPLVLHGGMPNLSDHPRRNIVIQWGTRANLLVTDNRESITGRTPDELTAMAAQAAAVSS
jgi:ectoine hydroxylase-related dioxygenase (phytanoyl-CoA dioxygenase family)